MALTEEMVKSTLQSLADNLQKVYKDCSTIGQAVAAMYNVMEKDCFPTLGEFQQVWIGGTSEKYVQKTNAKMNDIVQDCLDIRQAAEDILAKYMEYCKSQIKSLGLDPHTVFPDIF